MKQSKHLLRITPVIGVHLEIIFVPHTVEKTVFRFKRYYDLFDTLLQTVHTVHNINNDRYKIITKNLKKKLVNDTCSEYQWDTSIKNMTSDRIEKK